jgi:hypothetical protein
MGGEGRFSNLQYGGPALFKESQYKVVATGNENLLRFQDTSHFLELISQI